MASAVRIGRRLMPELFALMRGGDVNLRLLVRGDFIRGVHRKTGELVALDADHVPKLDPPAPPGAPQPGVAPRWLEPKDGRHSGDGVAGGTFRSWVTLQREG
jgi:hypothetical protein